LTSLFFDDINFSKIVEDKYIVRGFYLTTKSILFFDILAVSKNYLQAG